MLWTAQSLQVALETIEPSHATALDSGIESKQRPEQHQGLLRVAAPSNLSKPNLKLAGKSENVAGLGISSFRVLQPQEFYLGQLREAKQIIWRPQFD